MADSLFSIYYKYSELWRRREANSFGEVSREFREPARLTSGGIRATRYHQLACAPTPLSKASTDSSMNRLENFPSCETDDDLLDKVMRRLEPKIELRVEKAYAELLRQHRELKQEKVAAVEKVDKELQPFIVPDSSDSKKAFEEEATPEPETTITFVLALSARGQQCKDEQEPTDAALKRSNVEENVPVQMQRIEAMPTRPLSGIPSLYLNENSTREARKLTQGPPSNSRPHKLIRWQISQVKYRRKSKEHRRLIQFWRLKFCIHGLCARRPKQDKLMDWLIMKYIGQGKKRIHSLFTGVTMDLVIARKYEDFEDSRSNPFEEGEYDVILVSIPKLRTRRRNLAWPEVLSWMKQENEVGDYYYLGVDKNS